MKKVTFSIFILLFLASLLTSADGKRSRCKIKVHDTVFLDHVDVDFDNDDLVLQDQEGDYNTVKITREYELYINEEYIRTNKKQKKILREYYRHFAKIVHEAEKIGIEGAKLGVKGAAIGIEAATGVLEVIFTDYDAEELEKRLEEKAERLETKAEKLEDKAHYLEDLADELEDIHFKLKDSIDELRHLDWF